MRSWWPWAENKLKCCLFCQRELPGPVAVEGVMGVKGYICKDCIAMCTVGVASRDAEWRDQQIDALQELAQKPT